MAECEYQLISAAELADFMGVSVRTLHRYDEKGILPAFRRENGRRYYTSEHISMALDIMQASFKRSTKVKFCKNGINSIFGRVSVPDKWLECIGITKESPQAEISFDGSSIIISKNNG